MAILFLESQEPVFTQQKTRMSKYYLEAKELVVLLFDLSLILFYKKKIKKKRFWAHTVNGRAPTRLVCPALAGSMAAFSDQTLLLEPC